MFGLLIEGGSAWWCAGAGGSISRRGGSGELWSHMQTKLHPRSPGTGRHAAPTQVSSMSSSSSAARPTGQSGAPVTLSPRGPRPRRRSCRRRCPSSGRGRRRRRTGRSPSTPSDAIGAPRTAARNASVCGWPSSTRHDRRRPLGGQQHVEDRVGARRAAPAAPARRGTRGRPRSGRRRRPRRRPRSSSSAAASDLGHDRPMPTSVTAGGPSPRAARSRRPAPARAAARAPRRRRAPPPAPGRSAGCSGGSRPRSPSGAPEPPERVEQRPLQVLPERRLPRDAARLLQPDRRRDDRLVRAALGRERHARTACRRGSTARPRTCRTTTAPARGRRTGRTSCRSAAAAGRRATTSRRARRAARRGCPLRCRARCGWPCSDSRQRTSVSLSSANQSIRSPGCQTPTRLIQPPRFVDDATSGLTVTTCSATSGAAWARSTKKRPNACCVEAFPTCSRPTSAAARAAGAASGGSARAPAARPRRGTSRPPATPGERRPRVVGVGADLAGELLATAARLSSAEWFAGCPSVGRLHALIV